MVDSTDSVEPESPTDAAVTEPAANAAQVPLPDIPFERAGELAVGLLETALRTLGRAPVRARSSPASLLRGRIDVLVVELSGLRFAGLLVDRLLVRFESFRIEPGLPPRLKADNVGIKATVTQKAVDRWVRFSRLPVKLRLTPKGIVARPGLAGVALADVTTELSVAGQFLELRPRRASVLGFESPIMPPVTGFLPLPPLPRHARLRKVDHGEGTVTAWLDLGAIDEPITPDIARRIARALRLPLA